MKINFCVTFQIGCILKIGSPVRLLFKDDCQFPSYFDNTVKVQTNGFDADSEGSDCDLIPNTSNMVEERSESNSKCQFR